MEEIQKELAEIKEKCPKIEDTQLIACVPAIVTVKITKTEFKNLSVSFQFPAKYPEEPIVIELKSKVLADRLLDGLSKVCEEEAKKYVGQPQIIILVKFIKKFLEENPLCVCSDEIHFIKKKLLKEEDKLVLKQKTSQIVAKIREGAYYLNARFTVPDLYPIKQTQVEITDHNFPDLLKVNFLAQAVEISRQCVTPPLKKNPKAPPFEPKPALKSIMEFFVSDTVRKFVGSICPCCGQEALPADPKNVCNDSSSGIFLERMYCGHLFHHKCLDAYMKIPPFTGGKKCPTCGNRIYHEKFKVSPQLAEARWAHKEARQRELSEVQDFFE